MARLPTPMDNLGSLLAVVRDLVRDHGRGGWQAVEMATLSGLADAVESLLAETERQRDVIGRVNARCDHLGMALRDVKAERDALAVGHHAAVAQERERCARIVEQMVLIVDCADALRAIRQVG